VPRAEYVFKTYIFLTFGSTSDTDRLWGIGDTSERGRGAGRGNVVGKTARRGITPSASAHSGQSRALIRGRSVAFAGRLLSLDRNAARRLVVEAGGVMATPARADYLVLGVGVRAPSVRRAKTIDEGHFLSLLGSHARDRGLPTRERLRDVVAASHAARLYPRLTWQRRERLARHGLLDPIRLANGVGYRFADLRVLREFDEMLAAGITFSQALARVLPRAEGQLELRFPMADVKPRPKRIDLTMEEESADAWFDVGFCADRDRSGFPTAISAYRKALDLDPDHVPSLINLGNVYYELGRFDEARDVYTRATIADCSNPRTHFNLGNACDETGDLLGAMRAYRCALTLWPGYADAHFNLALVAEKFSSWGLARKHWRRFLELEPRSEWAAVARSHLEDARSKDTLRGR
jgi:tetratricopeptide (TPR) repeat protein